jgi:hypothetical protein
MITRRNAELERGIMHLKDVHARIANGHLQSRAMIIEGDLVPLAGSLNLMAERLQRLGQADEYANRLSKALGELAQALERYKTGKPFVLPPACSTFPEIKRLLAAAGFNGMPGSSLYGLTQMAGPSSQALNSGPLPQNASQTITSGPLPPMPSSGPVSAETPLLDKPNSLRSVRFSKNRSIDPFTPPPRPYRLLPEKDLGMDTGI